MPSLVGYLLHAAAPVPTYYCLWFITPIPLLVYGQYVWKDTLTEVHETPNHVWHRSMMELKGCLYWLIGLTQVVAQCTSTQAPHSTRHLCGQICMEVDTTLMMPRKNKEQQFWLLFNPHISINRIFQLSPAEGIYGASGPTLIQLLNYFGMPQLID